jgi:hypothetical protein
MNSEWEQGKEPNLSRKKKNYYIVNVTYQIATVQKTW